MTTAITPSAMKVSVDYLYSNREVIAGAPLDSIIGAVHMATMLDQQRKDIMNNIYAALGEKVDAATINELEKIVWGELV